MKRRSTPVSGTHASWRAVLVALLAAVAVTTAAPQHARADDGAAKLPWYVPDHIKAQYAGNIGWWSAGAGYTYLSDVVQTELFFGVVPAFTGNNRVAMATLKQTVVAHEFELGRHVRLAPLMAGVFVTYTFGSDYYVFTPEHLQNHYSRPTALRAGPLVGGRVRADIEAFGPIRSLGAYWELNANDLAIDAYINNPEFFDFYDVLSLGVGVRVGFE